MRVLVTGATGFTGRHVVDLCIASGAEVVALGRRPPPAAVRGEYLQADLTRPEEARRALVEAAPDLVVHLAARVSVPLSWSEPGAVLTANHATTLNLLEALRLEGADPGVLVAGSSEQYGPPRELPVTEVAPLDPRNPYATSKATADLLAGFYGEAYGLRVVRTRAFNHAGPGQGEAWVVSGFARQIAAAERAGAPEVTVVTGNVDVKRDFVDVRDVARAYWLLLEGGPRGVYNVCSGVAVSIADILAGLAEHTALTVTHRTDRALLRQNEVMEIVGSHDKLARATGWTPAIELRQTLADTLSWWRGELA